MGEIVAKDEGFEFGEFFCGGGALVAALNEFLNVCLDGFFFGGFDLGSECAGMGGAQRHE